MPQPSENTGESDTTLDAGGGFVPASEINDLEHLERRLQRELPGPLSRTLNGTDDADSDIATGECYLAQSWLSALHKRIIREQEPQPRDHRLSPSASERQYAVSIANRLSIDAKQLLEADAETEVKMLYEGLREL